MEIPYGHFARILHGCIDQAINSDLEEMELTASQGRIMGFLSRQQTPLCPRDLEEAFHLSHPTVSGLLYRLEQKGFLQLRTDPEDRRCKRIYILPKGDACNETMRNTIDGFEQKMVKGFSETDKRQFTLLLTRAMRNLSDNPDFQFEKEESKE